MRHDIDFIKLNECIYSSLKDHEQLINSINVFPVADKDTGRNLVRTFSNLTIKSNTLLGYAKGILYNSKGSSGTIIALFPQGLAMNINESLHIMFRNASEFTWRNIQDPKEGTILTAMKDVPEDSELNIFIKNYIDNSVSNLINSPKLLDILNDYHTYDSGILGFIYILIGVYEYLTNEVINFDLSINSISKYSEPNYKYCLELLGKFDAHVVVPLLTKLGNELVTVSHDNLSKVHIHTNDPSEVIGIVNGYGFIDEIKIDNLSTADTN